VMNIRRLGHALRLRSFPTTEPSTQQRRAVPAR
jgi:hypothetical protein